ncbi:MULTISPECIES: fructosamine kinase family protein [Olivibacter]|uniref:Fructosamine kinase family protein n=2 Tax=Olivibacter TaxID=376469 RepID=A0ABV6HK43_9SPHI|nr:MULTISPECIES: fructosamine kinase family protein [Olivibacter]QEL02065.1 fructosamine kinase family protein [Olivibacter sp. LS-1]
MFLSVDFIKNLEEVISKLIGTSFQILHMLPVSGGDIHRSYQIQGHRESFFIKINDADTLPNIFVLEREGLKLLKRVGGAVVPELLIAGQFNRDAFLLMPWIEKGDNSKNAQANLGRMLAFVHKNSHDYFGLEYDNYLGSLPQYNRPHISWSDFFIEERLKKQLERSESKGLIDKILHHKFEQLFQRLPSLFPTEPPALLHGDLWNGNYMVNQAGVPFLIDPAVYYGHREMDLALTQLFGGFDQVFYDAYQEVFPLEKDWKKRIDLWNLYILLFHANVFGGSYLKQVAHIIDKYS